MARIYDTEGATQKVIQQFSKIKESINFNTEEINIIDTAQKEIITEIEKNKKQVHIEGVAKQRFLYLMAGYIVYNDQRKFWYLYHAIMSIIVIEDINNIIRERYGEEYADVMDRLFRFGNLIEKIKIDQDHISEKDLNAENYNNPAYQRLQNNTARLSLINYEINHILIIILLYTSLGKMTIPSSAIQMMQKEYKPVSYQEERRYQREQPMD